MSLWLAALTLLGVAGLSAAGMLTVRRRAPAGTFFKDVAPAGAVYTVAGTGYMVILAFVFLIAFESYHGAKADAEEEATATLGLFHLAEPLGPKARDQLQGQLICYAHEVISDEWPVMRKRASSPVVDARITAMEQTFNQVSLTSDTQRAAFDHWFALDESRRQGRQGRISEAAPVVPAVIWLILIVGGVVVIVGVGFFADAEEARLPQAAMIGSLAVIVVSGLLLVRFLDRPYENQSGSIKPSEMTSSLAQMQHEHRLENPRAAIPCR